MARIEASARKPFNILEWLNGGRPGSYFRLGVGIFVCSGVGSVIGYLGSYVTGAHCG